MLTQADLHWRPIDTAPKDGTQLFLLCNGRTLLGWYEDRQIVSHGKTVHARQEWTYSGDFGLGALLGAKFEPTHWMPIPAPVDIETPEEVPA